MPIFLAYLVHNYDSPLGMSVPCVRLVWSSATPELKVLVFALVICKTCDDCGMC